MGGNPQKRKKSRRRFLTKIKRKPKMKNCREFSRVWRNRRSAEMNFRKNGLILNPNASISQMNVSSLNNLFSEREQTGHIKLLMNQRSQVKRELKRNQHLFQLAKKQLESNKDVKLMLRLQNRIKGVRNSTEMRQRLKQIDEALSLERQRLDKQMYQQLEHKRRLNRLSSSSYSIGQITDSDRHYFDESRNLMINADSRKNPFYKPPNHDADEDDESNEEEKEEKTGDDSKQSSEWKNEREKKKKRKKRVHLLNSLPNTPFTREIECGLLARSPGIRHKLSHWERMYLSRLVEKHGHNYEDMQKDLHLNFHQWTANRLKKEIGYHQFPLSKYSSLTQTSEKETF